MKEQTNLRIQLLTARLQELEKERDLILKQLNELTEPIIVSQSNKSGNYFLSLIEKFLQNNPKASKLQLAQRLKISQGRLYDLINGKRLISKDVQHKIGEVLELTLEEVNCLEQLDLEDRRARKDEKKGRRTPKSHQ